MSGSSTCNRCGRPVVWAKTARGKNMPVDPNPRRNGGYVLEAVAVVNGKVAFETRSVRSDDAPDKRYTCHLDTCPKRGGGAS